MILYINSYQHHDPALLQPIANEAARRGWHLMSGIYNLPTFVSITGPKAAVQAAEFENWNHADGQMVTKACHWNKIPTVGIQHGFPAGFHDRDAVAYRGKSTSDVYCLWGSWWRDWFDAKDFAVTGAPQLDHVHSITDADKAEYRFAFQRRYDGDAFGLLCPQLIAWPGNAWLSSRTIEERADGFIEHARSIGFDGVWLVRPHPSDEKYPERMAQHQRIADALNGILQRPSELGLMDVLPVVDVVAGMSTVLLEGVAHGAQAFPIGVEYLPNDMTDPSLLVRTEQAAFNICNIIERLVRNVNHSAS